ncbi:TPA: hypothetical protein QCP98_000730 [Bacillus cereus]|uniref:hypothetical protein n=1 Tax=Bacillus thuringiensis TaxID=1428 RepID=UPI00080F7151|nr:hypothetical protein [Bacillus thuringiensis]ANV70819.1 hypothetical protein BCM43_09995 [Bacillus thuringiensis]HDR4460008.1 hypothetical protein [Bacillus cereus]
MVETRLHYDSVRENIEKIFQQEEIEVSDRFLTNFLSILSRLCNYEEEGKKIRPRIVITNNIDEAIETVPNSYIVKTKKGNLDGVDMERILKSLIPFCNNGWHVFVDIESDYIQYGIIRAFSGPVGVSFSRNLLSIEDLDFIDFGVVDIEVISNFELRICGIRKHNLMIDFRLVDHSDEITGSFDEMIDDITQDMEPLKKDFTKRALANLLAIIPYKVHGTICVVVESDYIFPNDFLSDGTWFTNPIDLGEKIIDTAMNNKDIASSEAYYALSGLFLEMLNVDGITIIDSSARVRGFNVFVKKQPETPIEIPAEGGARKRAANTVLASKDPKIKGVYFLSQDGNTFYKRMGD